LHNLSSRVLCVSCVSHLLREQGRDHRRTKPLIQKASSQGKGCRHFLPSMHRRRRNCNPRAWQLLLVSKTLQQRILYKNSFATPTATTTTPRVSPGAAGSASQLAAACETMSLELAPRTLRPLAGSFAPIVPGTQDALPRRRILEGLVAKKPPVLHVR